MFPLGVLPGAGATVSAYWPFRSEIDPRPLLARLARLGFHTALPVTPPKGAAEPLIFRRWTPDTAMAAGHFSVCEPHAEAEEVVPDALLVPLLAFDRDGHRLGYGAGHFDRTLQGLRELRPVTAIGLAYAAQEVSRVPSDPHDQKLDGICTEHAYIRVRKDD